MHAPTASLPIRQLARAGQSVFARTYRRRAGAGWAPADVAAAVAWKLTDPNLEPGERARLRRVLRRHEPGAGPGGQPEP
jgi:hypothetical protein